jgi:predicted DCC family thiol-disulfide oxidoreductase YuxK
MQALTVFYDSKCPLCMAEVVMLRARARDGLLRFEDLSSDTFCETGRGFTCAQALEQIHGVLDDGRVLTGVEVFAEAYRRAGLPLLAAALTVPWLRPILGRCYRGFARNRHRISRAIGPAVLAISRRLFG